MDGWMDIGIYIYYALSIVYIPISIHTPLYYIQQLERVCCMKMMQIPGLSDEQYWL